jgi:hypothetical protein
MNDEVPKENRRMVHGGEYNRTLTIVALWQGRALSKSKGSPSWAIRTSIAQRLARTLLNRHVYTNTFKSSRCCGGYSRTVALARSPATRSHRMELPFLSLCTEPGPRGQAGCDATQNY